MWATSRATAIPPPVPGDPPRPTTSGSAASHGATSKQSSGRWATRWTPLAVESAWEVFTLAFAPQVAEPSLRPP
eukprot:12443545-Alexandrium_andersonii.AAC.1